MTIQAVLDIDQGTKPQTTVSAAAFTVTGINQCAIYVNLAAADFYRDNDVRNTLQRIIDHIRETSSQFQAGVVPVYFSAVLGSGKGVGSAIVSDASLASIAVGDVGIGVGTNALKAPSNKLGVRLRQIRDAMWDAERIYA